MPAFKSSTFLYLAMHAVAFAFMMFSVMGMPGNPDEQNATIALILKVWGGLLLMAWKGLPILLLGALASFYFEYDTIGKILSLISLALGLALLIVVILYYSIQTNG